MNIDYYFQQTIYALNNFVVLKHAVNNSVCYSLKTGAGALGEGGDGDLVEDGAGGGCDGEGAVRDDDGVVVVYAVDSGVVIGSRCI